MDKIINLGTCDWARVKFEMRSTFKMLFVGNDINNRKGKNQLNC